MSISLRIISVCIGICSFFILSLFSCISSSPALAKSCMKFLGSYDTPDSAFGVAVVGTTAYVADGYGGLQVIDVSKPSAPKLLGSYDTPGYARGITVVNTTAYVADGDSGLQIIDVSKPSAPKFLGSYNTPVNAYVVAVVGTNAYVADGDGGLQVIDVSIPSAPKLLGSYDTPNSAYCVVVVGMMAYVANQRSGLLVIDISKPSAPKLLGSCATPYAAAGVAVVGTTAYVVDEEGGLQVIDVSTPSAPTLLSSYDTPYFARGVAAVGTRVYVADYSCFLIIDVSKPSVPKLLDRYDTPAWGIAVMDTMAYIVDNNGNIGLQIINISDCDSDNKPTVKTKPATQITDYYATLNGIVNGHGLTTKVWFQYGTDSGKYKSNSSKKTVKGSLNKKVNIVIGGLSSQTTYYYRIAARNKDGTSYGNEMSFTPKATCKYSISPSSKSFSYSGGTGSVEVTVSSSSCNWKAASNETWITITSGSNGTGDGKVDYSVSVNTSTSSRTGTMTIAGKTFTVKQDGNDSSCKYVGTCKGTFSGDDYGTWNASIDNTCKVSASGYSELYDKSFTGTGVITSEGGIAITIGSISTGTVFSGQINDSNNISGTWWNDYYGINGTFKGVFTSRNGK